MGSDKGGNGTCALEQVGVRWRYLHPTDKRLHSPWELADVAPERTSEDEDEIESVPVFVVGSPFGSVTRQHIPSAAKRTSAAEARNEGVI